MCMAKTVEISAESFKQLGETISSYIHQAIDWLKNFFATIDTYEIIAVSAIGVGLILIIVGSIIM